MKKLMMLSALLLLTVVCVKAETGEDIPGSCVSKKCPDGQTAMMTEYGCKCPSSRDIVNAMNNNGPVMRMNAPKPS